jgi:hypothetical protein
MNGARYPGGAAAPSMAALSLKAPALFGIAPPPAQAAPPLSEVAAIDLVGTLARYRSWPVEDQSPRQTCVAFAATACIELLRAGQGTVFAPLSPQFLYWHIRTHPWAGDPPPGWAEGAIKLGYAKEILAVNGICGWTVCPYVAQLAPAEPLQGPMPTASAEAEGLANRIPNGFYVDYPNPDPASRPTGIARRIYDILAQHRPVAISLPVFYLSPAGSLTTWNNPQTTASGQVRDPPPGAAVSSNSTGPGTPGHAVCVIGFQPDVDELTGGWFIFRNSMGNDWADALDAENTVPPVVKARGYGAISASYVEHCCWEVFSPIWP